MEDHLKLTYQQVTCSRAVADGNFPAGVQDYNWSIGPPLGWVPNKSYFRIALELTGKSGGPPLQDVDEVAFADNVCAALYDNIYVRLGGQDASSITSYAPQGSMCKTRIEKSGAWLDNIGKSAFGCNADFESRQSQVETPTILLGAVGTTIAIAAADGRVTGANGSLLFTGESKLEAGDQIVVANVVYTIATPATDNVGADCTVTVPPAANVAATTAAAKLMPDRIGVGEGTNIVYFCWQPPVGIFDEAAPLGAGQYRIQLNPSAYYKTAAVQAANVLAPGVDFDLLVKDVQLYVATISTDISLRPVETLRLMEMAIQSKKLASGSNSTTLDFTVPPSTRAITIFAQAGNSGSTTLVPPTMFKTADGSDLGLKNIQISYGGQNKPSTRWTSEYKEGSTNYMTQRYSDSQMYADKMFTEGGAEPIEDWFARGPMYHFSWIRDQNDRSTHCQVNIQYENMAADTNLFLCAHYSNTVQITSENGYVTDVTTLAA